MSLPRPADDQLLIIMGFVGHMGAGKSTATQYLHRTHGFNEIGFADAVRAAMNVLHITKSRENMQRFGTDLFRKQWNEDIWVRNLEFRIGQHIKEAHHRHEVFGSILGYAIPDIRFENEALWVRKVGGHIIGIDTLHRVLYERALKRTDKDPPKSFDEFRTQMFHLSESNVPKLLVDHADFHIVDDGISMDELCLRIDVIFREILEAEMKRRLMQEEKEALSRVEARWKEFAGNLDQS